MVPAAFVVGYWIPSLVKLSRRGLLVRVDPSVGGWLIAVPGDIVFLSWNGGAAHCASEHQALVDDMEKFDVRVRPINCDLSRRDQVVRASQKHRTLCSRIRRYLVQSVSLEGWRHGLDAKVMVTKNLHDASKDLPFHFFVMATSIFSVVSFKIQTVDSVANNFQTQFERYRRSVRLDQRRRPAEHHCRPARPHGRQQGRDQPRELLPSRPGAGVYQPRGHGSCETMLRNRDRSVGCRYVRHLHGPGAHGLTVTPERDTSEAGPASRSNVAPRWV